MFSHHGSVKTQYKPEQKASDGTSQVPLIVAFAIRKVVSDLAGLS